MKKHLSLFIALLIWSAAWSQNYDITGIKRIQANSLSAIIENNQVKGYYAFYPIDKVNKKENLYVLAILDNNLKQTHSVELKKSNKLRLLESAFDGQYFCFSFVNFKEKTVEYMVIDSLGKTAGSYILEASSSELATYSSIMASDEDTYSGGMLAAKGKGFIRLGYEKEKGRNVCIEMIDHKGKIAWTSGSGETDKKTREVLMPFYADDKTMMVALSSYKSVFGRGFKSNIMLYNVNNGKVMWTLPVKDDKVQVQPLGANFDETSGSYFLYGQYFGPDDNMAKDDSKGFFMQEIDGNGKIIAESYSPWEGEINNLMLKRTKGNYEKNMKIFMHKVIKTADGKVIAVGEEYRKAVSALGVASKLLNARNSNIAVMKIELHDMVSFEFDKNLKITDVQIYEKKKTNIQLPAGFSTIDANKIGYILKVYNEFDYAFTSISSDRKTFNVAYINQERDKEEGSEFTIGNISYNKDHKLVSDKIKLKSKPSYFFVLPGKPGYICIIEYFHKEKKVTVRLEKLNI